MKPPLPPNESQRLDTLRAYGVLDTAPESAFDDLTLLAAQICQVPIAVVSLVDENRQWFKSILGLSVTEASRGVAFCAYTILCPDEILEVCDAQLDPRFADNPLVTADPHIRFYAGAPLVAPDGLVLGALCVIDREPRMLSTEQKVALRALSSGVIAQLELRRTLALHRRAEEQLQLLNASLEQAVEARTAELRREITERKLADRKVQKLNADLTATLQAIPDLLFELDQNGEYINVWADNPKLLAAQKEILIGHTVSEMLPIKAANTVMSALREAGEQGYSSGQIIHLDLPHGKFWFELSASVKATTDASAKRFMMLSRNITERKQAENALLKSEKLLVTEVERRLKTEQAIRHVAAVVSFQTGESFLQHLVAGLAKVFDADYAFVGVCDDPQQPQSINTMSVYAHGQHVDNMSYSLPYAPCANVVGRHTCVYPERVCQLFPDDPLLQDMGVESYIGAPMFDAAGQPLGLVAVLDGNPMADTVMVVEILEIFVARAAAELQRLHDEQQLRIAATAFESQESLMITDAAGVILRVNHAFTKTTGYTAEDAVGQTPRLLKSDRHNAAFYQAMWESLNRTGTWQGEIWDRRKNGEIYPKWLSISAVKGSDGIVSHYVGSHTDITERKAAEEKIEYLAFYDPLTRLPNRRLLTERLGQTLASGARSGKKSALLFIDLDNFKTLNDSHGHDIGDQFLQQVAQRLESCVREGDTVPVWAVTSLWSC